MLKRLFAVLLLASGLSLAKEGYRSRFLIQADLGLNYMSVSGEHETRDIFGQTLNVKMGFLAKGLWAIHGNVEYGIFESSPLVHRIGGALGASVFPFRDPRSALHDFYAGANFGFVDNFSFDEISGAIGEASGIYLKVEAGKLWPVSERWNIGVNVSAGVDGYFTLGESGDGSSGVVIGLGVSLARK